jgi:hypothetical protein
MRLAAPGIAVLALLGGCTLTFDPQRLRDADGGGFDSPPLDGSLDAEGDAEGTDADAPLPDAPLPDAGGGATIERLGPMCPRPSVVGLDFELVPLGPVLPYSGGVLLEDLDGDSDLDLVAVDLDTQATLARVFETIGDTCAPATLSDRTSALLGSEPGVSSAGVLAVPLIDADIDLIVPGIYDDGSALPGRMGPPLWGPPAEIVPGGEGRLGGNGMAAGDLDGDGNLDLVVVTTGTSGRFFVTGATELVEEVPSPLLGNSSRVWIADFDLDGVAEVLVLHDDAPAQLLRLEGRTLIPDDMTGAENIVARELVFGDFDDDGDLDAVGVNAVEVGGYLAAVVYENRTTSWIVGTAAGGLSTHRWNFGNSSPSTPWGAADLDLDGDLDFVMGFVEVFRNGAGMSVPPFAFGYLSLTDLGPILAQSPRLAIGDLEGDGDVDVAVTSSADGDPRHGLHLARNTLGGGHWLRVRLSGPARERNRRGVGATVCVFAPGMLPATGCVGDGLIGMRPILASTAQPQALEASFGIPSDTPVDLRVLWPADRAVSDARNVAIDQSITVVLP